MVCRDCVNINIGRNYPAKIIIIYFAFMKGVIRGEPRGSTDKS